MPGALRAGQTANSMDSALEELPKVRGSRYKDEFIQMRDILKAYLASEEDSVSWQTDYVSMYKKDIQSLNVFLYLTNINIIFVTPASTRRVLNIKKRSFRPHDV